MKLHPGMTVYWWTSASEFHAVTFEGWCRARMDTGGKDTNKIGVGAIVSSDWLFSKTLRPKVEHGLRRGQARLRPYWDLYFTSDDAREHRNPIKRPTVDKIGAPCERCLELSYRLSQSNKSLADMSSKNRNLRKEISDLKKDLNGLQRHISRIKMLSTPA